MNNETIEPRVIELFNEKKNLFENNPEKFEEELTSLENANSSYGITMSQRTTIVSDRDKLSREQAIKDKVSYLVFEAAKSQDEEYQKMNLGMASEISRMNYF